MNALAPFIVSETEAILVAWEDFARTMSPGMKLSNLALCDHAGDLLLATVRDMDAAQVTKRVDESRDMFLAILSHDLRSPLSAISMTAQLTATRPLTRSRNRTDYVRAPLP